jgi:hypothetical protein
MDKSTAGATSGATQAGTPRRNASVQTLPKPKMKVKATTTPAMRRNLGHIQDSLVCDAHSARNSPWR